MIMFYRIARASTRSKIFGLASTDVAQRPPESFKRHFRFVARLKPDALSERQASAPMKWTCTIPGLAMGCEFEMVVLKIRQAVAHVRLAGSNPLLPNCFSVAKNPYLPDTS